MQTKTLNPNEYSQDRLNAMKELGKTKEDLIKEYNTSKVIDMKNEKKKELANELIKVLDEKSIEPSDMKKVLSCAYHIAKTRCDDGKA